MALNIILAVILAALIYIGYIQFRSNRGEPDEVEHEEVHPESEHLEFISHTRRGYFKQRSVAQHWMQERNRISKVIR